MRFFLWIAVSFRHAIEHFIKKLSTGTEKIKLFFKKQKEKSVDKS